MEVFVEITTRKKTWKKSLGLVNEYQFFAVNLPKVSCLAYNSFLTTIPPQIHGSFSPLILGLKLILFPFLNFSFRLYLVQH